MGALLFPILTGTVNVYPLPGEPPSGDQVANVLAHNQIDILCLIPPVIEQIGRNPQLLQKLSAHVDQMMWSGGDISTEAGNAISTRFKLFSQVGSTEVGLFHHIRPAEEWNYENWHYVGFHPSSNVQLIHREGRSHEAVVQRNTNDYTQTVFNLFPESLEYTTGDLFTQHPHQSQLWEYQGRSDDMLVFLSGEKFYPVDVERILCRNPGIQEAILIGTGRSQAALLLDLVRGNDEHDGDIHKTLERIWPVIDATNELSPAYAKVSRDCILVVDPKRPIIRTAKGNVQRNATIKLYQNEITKLDEAAANSNATVPHTACELLTEGSTM
jgi:acyl-coenzyme A synthetase/AMP-(fatty) acid ligase